LERNAAEESSGDAHSPTERFGSSLSPGPVRSWTENPICEEIHAKEKFIRLGWLIATVAS
jgi:hypothetical protein